MPRLAALWPEQARFRKHIVMQRHGYGQGEYQYFAYDLPAPVERLRQALYPALAEVANRWNERLGKPRRFPATLDAWLRECHEAGQTRPTPLLLRYGPGDYNCLHRDLYGEMVFPLQVVVLLSAPGRDFSGGRIHAERSSSAAHAIARRGSCPSNRVMPRSSQSNELPPGRARLASHRPAPRVSSGATASASTLGLISTRRGLANLFTFPVLRGMPGEGEQRHRCFPE